MPTPWSVASKRIISNTPTSSELSFRVSSSSQKTVDGEVASQYIANAICDLSLVYDTDEIPDNRVNSFGKVCLNQRMETTAGAGSSLVGALAAGATTSVSANSSTLVHMIPTLHKLASERHTAVFHASAHALHSDDLSISTDLGDILRCANSGAGFLHSRSVQESHDLAIIAHLVAHRAQLPFVHFFDGVTTGKELIRTNLLSYTKLSQVAASIVEDKRVAVAKKEIPTIVDEVMSSMRRVLKKRYNLFEYSGSSNAEYVIVSLCNGKDTTALTSAVEVLRKRGHRVGVLNIRLLRPWSVQHFLRALPLSFMKRCAIVVSSEDAVAAQSVLSSVSASLTSHQGIKVMSTEFLGDINLPAGLRLVEQMSTCDSSKLIVEDAKVSQVLLREDIRKTIVWEHVKENSRNMQSKFVQCVGDNSNLYVQAASDVNSYALGGATSSTALHLSTSPFATPNGDASADVVACHEVSILDQFDVAADLKNGGSLLVNTTATGKDELEVSLPASVRRDIASRNLKFYAFDALKVSEENQQLALQVALILLSDVVSKETAASALLKTDLAEELAALHGVDEKTVFSIVDQTDKLLQRTETPDAWIADGIAPPSEDGVEAAVLPTKINRSSICSGKQLEQQAPLSVSSWNKAALHLLFPEAYGVETGLRPDEHAKTYVVKVQENRRLTPDEYDRNVFHIEFDTRNTNLKYKIGEALGVYGHNDAKDVAEFIEFYGLNAHDTVSIRGHDGRSTEVRTVEQVLTQYLDITGRPGRRFYSALAPFATDATERAHLEKLSSAEGGAEFKKRVDATVTFMDLFKEFKSAHPTFEELCELVPYVKARHYSIASSQRMHPNSVHLLVVLVGWKNPDGEQRYGQCTNYLVNLKPGTDVTVDIMPSVLKLPEDNTKPLVMAGLGTGLAPFRAFIQERAALHAEGVKVGPMALYFGSRSQRMEYLYGEELEAYKASGLLPTLQGAFSRDGPNKVYIQHKLQEDATVLSDMLQTKGGSFFLCGPTWPAGDVQDAITSAFKHVGGVSDDEAAAQVQAMKDEQRYILEVY